MGVLEDLVQCLALAYLKLPSSLKRRDVTLAGRTEAPQLASGKKTTHLREIKLAMDKDAVAMDA